MNVEDDYDHEAPGLIYTPTNVPGSGIDPAIFDEELQGCSCSESCTENCPCLHNFGQNYDANGRFLKLSLSLPVFECHEGCKCSSRVCGNRRVGLGPLSSLSQRETPAKGRGLFAREKIERGTFVCEYAGEVISKAVAKERLARQVKNGLSNYIIFVNEGGSNVTVVDPTLMGNVGRYINHCCDPNLEMVPVRIGSVVPRLALYARRDIEAGSELSFDYGGLEENDETQNQDDDNHRTICRCGSQNCNKYLPFESL